MIVRPYTCIGETERYLKACFQKHKRPSSVNSEVSHQVNVFKPEHSVSLDNDNTLMVENKKFEMGVKESIHIMSHRTLTQQGWWALLTSSSVDQPAESQSLGTLISGLPSSPSTTTSPVVFFNSTNESLFK